MKAPEKQSTSTLKMSPFIRNGFLRGSLKTHVSSGVSVKVWISGPERGTEDAAVALLVAVCTKVKTLTYGRAFEPWLFWRVLIVAGGGHGIRVTPVAPFPLLAELENVKHEPEEIGEETAYFEDHARWLLQIPKIRIMR
ncbi:hypothetical protein FBEOM_13509 [Fusarium beomiforme]|uniref:Uncharacterized protein n=1 Tax=Fusarium beomiforme TaxID=44412 RepID=A0A9P5A5P7_9HYPO|nr:hypothetical protein FBEOM_13509 [Fusarium beomiforme]